MPALTTTWKDYNLNLVRFTNNTMRHANVMQENALRTKYLRKASLTRHCSEHCRYLEVYNTSVTYAPSSICMDACASCIRDFPNAFVRTRVHTVAQALIAWN